MLNTLKQFFNYKSVIASGLVAGAVHTATPAPEGQTDQNLEISMIERMPKTLGEAAAAITHVPLAPTLAFGLTFLAAPSVSRKVNNQTMTFKERFKTREPGDIRRTAYHEAAHALVRVLQPSNFEIKDATIMANAYSLGCIKSTPIKPNFTRQEGLNNIACGLAAKIAEAEVFGSHESGIIGDLVQTTMLAENMVKLFDMGKGVPPKNYQHETVRETLTDADKKMLNDAVNQITTEAEDLARKTIRENRPALDALAARLIEIRNPYRPWGNNLKAPEIKEIIAAHTQSDIPLNADPAPISTFDVD